MTTIVWTGFLVFILAMVALDLGVFHRRDVETTIKSALLWTCGWISLAVLFNVVVYYLYEYHVQHPNDPNLDGKGAVIQFFTGYLLEYSLSVDNIFVIALVIAFFRVPAKSQHRLLFWGVLGAVIARGIMIGIGAALIATFEWVIYIFGLLLILSAVKMLFTSEENIHPEKNILVRITRRIYPVSSEYDGSKFFTTVADVHALTPMAVALLVITWLDTIFAVDSIPAIFAVTKEPFLVFTSNIFAILGLRSLYFALAGLMDKFRYLKVSLVILLMFIGVKMLVSHLYPIPNEWSLIVICAILTTGILASLWADKYGSPVESQEQSIEK